MTGAEVIALLTLVLPLVAKYAPGVLASLTGHQTDEEALAHADAKLTALRQNPAASAIDDELHRAAAKPTSP